MGLVMIYKGIFNFYATIKMNHSTKVEMQDFDFMRIKNQKRNSKLKMKFDIDIGRQKCKIENEIWKQKSNRRIKNGKRKSKIKTIISRHI